MIHVGFMQSAFRNAGQRGQMHVRLIDGSHTIVHQGSETLKFLPAPVPQVHLTNLAGDHRNHDWQRVKPGDVLGHTPGTRPLAVMLYANATVPSEQWGQFKQGIVGAGLLCCALYTRTAHLDA